MKLIENYSNRGFLKEGLAKNVETNNRILAQLFEMGFFYHNTVYTVYKM